MFVNSFVTDDKISIFKMIQSSIGGGAFSKQDAGTSDDRAQTSSRAWSALKNNSRIVRVSRTFGGKDRHSKVRTIRGLRDRRIRLSVSTAIQLYDLQDKLGFNQPSKVVDWLINAAQHEIDKLPPLEMLQGNLIQFPQSVANSHMMNSTQPYFGHTIRDDNEFLPRDKAYRFVSSPHLATSDIFNSNVVEGTTLLPKSVNDSSDVLMRSKEKEALKELSLEKGNITRGNVENRGFVMENSAISYSPYYHLEPPNGYSSHAQSEVPHGCHPIAIFSSYMAHNVDSKQYSHIQMASSASSNAPSDPLRTSLHVGIPFLQQNCTALKHPQDRYETYTADS